MMKTTLALTLAAFLCTDGFAQERRARQEKKQEKQDKTDWNKKYEEYLAKNPAIAKKVKSGEITKAQVLAGMKARVAEKAKSEEEQLEEIYQQMLKDHPGLKDAPKDRVMPRVKAMLAERRGEQAAEGGGAGRRRGRGEADELADRQKKFRAKIGELVRAGKITRREAGELWTLAFGEARGRAAGGDRRRRDGGDERRRRKDGDAGDERRRRRDR